MSKFVNVNNCNIGSTPWLINNVIPTNSICMISGGKGELNTLFATELALHISSGNSWNGHEVSGAKSVVYLTQESHLIMAKRRRNWALENNCNRTLPFYLSKSTRYLLGPNNDTNFFFEVNDFLYLQSKKQTVGMVLIDVEPYLYNDVNSTKPTVRQLINISEYIRTQFNCTVLMVHNQGTTESSRAFKYLYKNVDMVMHAEQMGEPLDNVILFTKFTGHKLPKPIFVERFLRPMLGGTVDE